MTMQRSMFVVVDLDEYSKVFDHAWSKAMLERTEGTCVEEAAFALNRYWRGATSTHVLPWLMARSLQVFHDSALNAPMLGPDFVAALSKWTRESLSDQLNEDQLLAVAVAIERFSNSARAIQKRLSDEPGVDMWDALLTGDTEPEFAWCLWGSQRLSYGAIYHAYEDFIRHCIGILDGSSYFRDRDLFGALQRAFGGAGAMMRAACLEDDDVAVARHARNAIAHNGGKPSPELLALNHQFKIVDDEIQVVPRDTRRLFSTLKVKADLLADNTIEVYTQQKGSP
jgi:hypothetical protein